MKKVLILEDEVSIRSFVVINLKRAGYEAVEAGTGMEALEQLKNNPDIGVAILDIMLPDMDGFEVCRRIRATNKQMGVIMLTARTQEMDKITGLMTGADDYVTKPFSLAVLEKRIDALIKRSKGNVQIDMGLIINAESYTATIDSKPLDLTVKEFELLKILKENAGRVFTRDQLLDTIWGYDYDGDIRTVDSHIARLRVKLGEYGNKHLKTIYGVGYKLDK